MLKNYFKTAFRNLIKHKGYSFINISGLALGIASCLLIMLYVKDELTFDQFHENGDNIYRVRSTSPYSNGEHNEFVRLPTGPTAKDEIPAVINQCRYTKSAFDIRIGDKIQNQGRVFYAEPEFMEIFSFPSIYGDAKAVLSGDNQIALIERAAERIFGDEMAVGKSIDLNINGQWKTFSVGAVVKNPPSNSSIDFEVLLPFQTYLTANNRQSNNVKDWFSVSYTFQTFIQVLPNTNLEVLTSDMDEMALRKMGDMPQYAPEFSLQPITDIHFSTSKIPNHQAGMRESGNETYSKVLTGLALLILVLACINFTNLSLARSLPRAKEIGLRKVIGARKRQLVTQFLGEAFLMSTAAFLFGVLIAELALPAFELAAKKEFSISLLNSPFYLLVAFIVVTLTAFVAGSYPALVISRFKTVAALKGNYDGISSKGGLQKLLIVFQFAVAGVLIIGVLTMNRQINFLVNMDRGYDDTNLLSIPFGNLAKTSISDTIRAKGQALLDLMRNDLVKVPSVRTVSGASSGYSLIRIKEKDGKTGEDKIVQGYGNVIDANYFKTMGVTLLAGRDFDLNDTGGSDKAMIVNEEYAKLKNFKDSVDGGINMAYGSYNIIGIIKNFNQFSPINKVVPATFQLNYADNIRKMLVKFEPGTLSTSLAAIEDTWNKFNPNNPFNFTLLEESNDSQFAEQERWQSIIFTASMIAICISCLGLFGLAFMSTQRRTKEIGVRKVFGAPVPNIVYILSRGFSALVMISLLIAVPVAYYAGGDWLATFPYRINMTWDLFLIAGLIQLIIAFLTVSYHAIKTAISDPVKALRYE
ncbi:ABC transporter permease [Roseivirga sp.]|uniref:ABC transporter permease n=1 Tax=Roseivirga sp. TaxID=1964215 RepID=UPI003B8B842F